MLKSEKSSKSSSSPKPGRGETDESSSENERTKTKHQIPSELREKLRDMPEALSFIKQLQKQIRKQKSKLKKYKLRLKHKIKTKSVCTQTNAEECSNGVCAQAGPKSLADEIKEAAEIATQNAGFVYDENTGMYYDSNTGYYYSSEYGLYFDATSGTYLTYKQETNTYEFHSQVYANKPTERRNVKRKKKIKETKAKRHARYDRHTRSDDSSPNETEEGECTTDSDHYNSDSYNSESSDYVKQWPPCMRLIVEQSTNPKIKIGSLFILTFDGGTLGREGAHHAILLPDINVSKCHLRFTFDPATRRYSAADLGSRNGTVLNGRRMSPAKRESAALEVRHGSRLQLGAVVLLCHVHDGSATCGLCEPGLVRAVDGNDQSDGVKPEPIVATKSEGHRAGLRKLKKKYGVSGFEEGAVRLAEGYKDRAQGRRETVGSLNPHEKTEVASVDAAIGARNKGFRMLEKMGWREGEALGRDGQGIAEPVPIVSNPGTSGIGSEPLPVAVNSGQKGVIWKKAQERFQLLPVSSIFDESD